MGKGNQWWKQQQGKAKVETPTAFVAAPAAPAHIPGTEALRTYPESVWIGTGRIELHPNRKTR